MAEDLGRRDLIKLVAGGAIAQVARPADAPKFFTADEYRMVDELGEIIIPADEKSGGARAAKVVDFIDARLAEAFDAKDRDDWRAGLKLVNAVSVEIHHRPFLDATPEQRTAVAARLARNELASSEPEQIFFRNLKDAVARGYYTSRIGIHDDMDYKGNTIQQGEYAGYLP
jgi:gluconate 2-dehydrogenase gamma chain